MLHHRIEAIDRLLDREAAKVFDEPVRAEIGCTRDVDHDTLNSGRVLVQIQSFLQETGLLAQRGNTSLVEVREHVVAKDSICDLRGVDQVHLQKTGLKMALLRLVVLERVEEEGGGLLNHALGLEDVHYPLEIDQRSSLMVGQRRRELGT